MRRPEIVALLVAVLALVATAIGLTVALGAPAWALWGLGVVVSLVAVVKLAARALDERTIRGEAARFAPEPPPRPQGPQL